MGNNKNVLWDSNLEWKATEAVLLNVAECRECPQSTIQRASSSLADSPALGSTRSWAAWQWPIMLIFGLFLCRSVSQRGPYIQEHVCKFPEDSSLFQIFFVEIKKNKWHKNKWMDDWTLCWYSAADVIQKLLDMIAHEFRTESKRAESCEEME